MPPLLLLWNIVFLRLLRVLGSRTPHAIGEIREVEMQYLFHYSLYFKVSFYYVFTGVFRLILKMLNLSLKE